MKIAILTFHHAFNYGAELQCFALQYKLNSMGYNAEVIYNFRPMNDEYQINEGTKFKPYYDIRNTLTLKTRLNIRLSKWINLFVRIFLWRRVRSRKRRFYNFHKEYTRLTEQKFYNFDMLYDYNWDNYTHFIVGSDQVWNHLTTYSNEPYFLTFAPENAKKISYAASIGHSQLPQEVKCKYGQWLDSFDSISVREKEGVGLLHTIVNKNVSHVLDPTLLLSKDEWKNSLSLRNRPDEDYVLVYVLIHSAYAIELAKWVAHKLKLKVKLISPSDLSAYSFKKGIDVLYNCGPKEFVELFYNAKFVVTNSFHGTAFAINMNKPFYSCPRKNSLVLSRFISLLKILGIENRLIFDGSKFPQLSSTEIDYHKVNKILEEQRAASLDFIRDALV